MVIVNNAFSEQKSDNALQKENRLPLRENRCNCSLESDDLKNELFSVDVHSETPCIFVEQKSNLSIYLCTVSQRTLAPWTKANKISPSIPTLSIPISLEEGAVSNDIIFPSLPWSSLSVGTRDHFHKNAFGKTQNRIMLLKLSSPTCKSSFKEGHLPYLLTTENSLRLHHTKVWDGAFTGLNAIAVDYYTCG